MFFTHRGRYGFVLNRPEEVSFEKQILFDKGFCFSKKKKEIDFEARMPGKNKKVKENGKADREQKRGLKKIFSSILSIGKEI